ncbi:BamA/TamA family outer membrane protein [Croceitalea rosinachiae]|uniref:BamA/TamA family outer membrane protein n=1 Tax=Croceitalea rosinachiae TaxID=3075596 RepID=A0ABU3A6G3_9FLAO|nr:BamA/TamA family outer membrane protein [Croceitalea sp. F388]MDT0605420.1 BamA/TamA family outer membrane protein [Croceitalea sp. F388]
MKLHFVLKKYRAKIGLLLAMIALASCNAIKKVGEQQLLLTKNTVYADGEKTRSEEVKGLMAQKPNSTLLGYPLRLNLYNLAKESPDSLYQDWLTRKEGRQNRLNRILSEKQVKRLGESFVVRGYSNLFKRIGEPPAIIDSARTKKTIERLEGYYGSKGYFNNSASYSIAPSKRKKRAEINFNVTLGKPYFIDSITKNITSKQLDSIYHNKLDEVLLKKDQQFDLATFTNERQRLTTLFRNSGVHNFQESSINYSISRDTTIIADDQKMDIQLNIKNPGNPNDSIPKKEYKVSRFERINIFADYQFNNDISTLDSINYQNYTIYFKEKLKYKPKALTDAIFFEKDSIYRDLDYVRTNRQITNLNTFKYPSIKFDENNENATLVANVFLAPRSKYSLDTSLELSRSNFQLVGTSFGASVITRNVFGGAETLSLSARGSIGLLDDEISEESFTSEIGGDINLTFPRIWFPLNTEKIIPYYMLPQTRLSIGTNFQQNLGLDRQSVNSVLGYNWSPTNFQKNTLELFNIEFVRNTDTFDFFRVFDNTYQRLDNIANRFDGFRDPSDPLDNTIQYPELSDAFEVPDPDNSEDPRLIIPIKNSDAPNGTADFTNAILTGAIQTSNDTIRLVRSIEERRQRLTQNNLIFTSNFTYQKNNRQDINDNSFYQYRIRFESAGNLLSAISNIIPFEKNSDGQQLVYGVPYSQYFKTDFDFIKHWRAGNQQVLAFHGFVGLAVPYGNADNIPFVRSYFGGGANDNRAWNVYTLGPGRTENLNDFNEANFKLAFNLEYRFPIVGDIKGALFADAGNIWNVFDNVEDEDATFNGFESLGDIALGTGLGLRYDFTYFVIRLDMGLKTYNPALSGSERWFTNFRPNQAVYNIGINYPF